MTSPARPQTRIQPQPNQYRDAEHPFAEYVRILGKGRRGSRALTGEEAERAFAMILDREVLDVQLGAFLMLLRVKEESVAELAGFVRATRSRLSLPAVAVDLDWPSYAGKRRHYPWYLLAALTLARHGVRVVMHGAAGHTVNRLYAEDVLTALGYPIVHQASAVAGHLAQRGFAYVPLSTLSPVLGELIDLRNVMGLRSPVHTLARLINPFAAPYTVQAIFHPAYRSSHQQAAAQLGAQNMLVIKGEGGEFEYNPDADLTLAGLRDGQPYEENWPRLNGQRSDPEPAFALAELIAVWEGRARHAYGEQAVLGTLALALYTMQKADSRDAAWDMARRWWAGRQDIRAV
jgi:anthranilate phosphoribosyltransferase